METNELDLIIEKSIKQGSMEVEIRQPVMARIQSYETGKARRSRNVSVFVSIYVCLASLFSLFYLHHLAVRADSFFQKSGINLLLLKLSIQGIFVVILIGLVVLALYSISHRRVARASS